MPKDLRKAGAKAGGKDSKRDSKKDPKKDPKEKITRPGKLNKVIGEGGKYPSKTSVNLYVVEKHTGRNIVELLVFAVFMVILYLFSKYVVGGALEEEDRLQSNYQQRIETLEKMKEQAGRQDDVKAEYAHYSNEYRTDDEKSLQDRLAILDVIERRILKDGALESISLDGNVATLIINSEKLSNVSQLTADLESEKIVSYVTVSTAQKNLVPAALSPVRQAREAAREESESEAAAQTETTAQTAETAQSETAPETEYLVPEVVTTLTIYFLTPDEVESLAEETETETEVLTETAGMESEALS